MSSTHNKYEAKGSTFGGNLADHPGWEDRLMHKVLPNYRRKIFIAATNYVVMGGMHHYPSIRADSIPFWDPDKEVWVECWDHPDEYSSRYYDVWDFPDVVPTDVDEDGRFLSFEGLYRWVTEVVEKHFPADKFNVEMDFEPPRPSLKDRQKIIQGD